MSGCESWTVKKAECWRIDAFELWCWRRLLRVPWTARRSNKSILKEISPEYSLEGLMLKLKLQYFGHLMQRADIWKDPYAGKDWGQEEKGTTGVEMVGWHHWLNGHGFAWTLGVGDGWGAWRATVRGVTKSQTWLTVELNWCSDRILSISLGNCGNLAVFCENFWVEISTVLKRLWRFSCLSRNHQTFWT